MRILWVTPYLPVPNFGGGTRVFNLMKALAARGDAIDLIAASDPGQRVGDDLRAVCRTIETETKPTADRWRKRLLQVRALVSRHPSQYWLTYLPGVRARITRAIAERPFDIVMLAHSFNGYYPIPSGVPVVLDQHNVESALLLRSGKRERSPVRRAYNLLEYARFRADERRICRGADLLLATSALDREVMEAWGDLPPCVVIPNGVDTTYFAPQPEVAEVPNRLVFTATMNYGPNAEAAIHFATHIWPRVRAAIPDATLKIVGHGPPAPVRQLGQRPGITVTGSVPDVRPYLASAQAVVVPLRIGGGTRLKIVEALAMAKPVVTTTLGAEGLAVEPGRHLLIADDPDAFASDVIALLRDPAQRASLAHAGRALVEERYDWSAIGAQLDDALHHLLPER